MQKVFTEHSTNNKRREIRLLRPLEKWIYSRYDKVVCVSQGAQTSLLKWLGGDGERNQTVLINNGARLLTWKAHREPPENGLRLVSIGSLTKKKGFDVALEAVARVKDSVQRYVLIGEGEERERLERQAKALGLADLVQFIGWSDEIEHWLHCSDIQLIPSRWEGFGLAAVEGLSTGLPIVAADVEGLNEILGNTPAARLVSPGDPERMAEAILAFYKEMHSFSDIALASRERALQYGLDSMVANYARTYREMQSLGD